MQKENLYEDARFSVSSDEGGFLVNFKLPNKSYHFTGFEVENLIRSSRQDLEDRLNKKIKDARLFLIDQGLSYDAVGFVLAQAYAVHGDLMREARLEANLPKCRSGR